jgi:hypothetical protein
MRLDTVDYAPSGSDGRKTENEQPAAILTTPARRAALDALEREFHDLLPAHPR